MSEKAGETTSGGGELRNRAGQASTREAQAAEAAAAVLKVNIENVKAERLPGHASARVYYRVRTGPAKTSPSVIVMLLPPEASRQEEVGSSASGKELPFVSVQRYLSSLGVRVPAIHAVHMDLGILVIEDLGDTTLESALDAARGDERVRHRLYGTAVDQLAFMRLESERRPDLVPFDGAFELDLLRWELDHFVEWGLEAGRGVQLTSTEKAVVDRAFEDIALRLAQVQRGFTHRDYQSRNLMVVHGGLAVIDFQDALLGPISYDLVALLRDSYVSLERVFVDSMLDRYSDAWRALGGPMIDREELDAQFDLQTIQRKLKDAGRFVFIDKVKNNPDFLPHIPASLKYVREALHRMPEYRDLHDVLARHVHELGAS